MRHVSRWTTLALLIPEDVVVSYYDLLPFEVLGNISVVVLRC